MKSLLIFVFDAIGEAFREQSTAVLRVRNKRPVSVKGESFREYLDAISGGDLAWTTYFRGFSESKGEAFRGLSRQCEAWVVVASHWPMRGELNKRRRSSCGCCGAAKTPPRFGIAAANGPCGIGPRAPFIRMAAVVE